ncbi:hypothetical protein [Streptomyces sp. Ru62]|nr:hypothetical protein [Streptomyces sp. Ru62]
MTGCDEGGTGPRPYERHAAVAGFRPPDPGYFGQMTKVTEVAELGVDP